MPPRKKTKLSDGRAVDSAEVVATATKHQTPPTSLPPPYFTGNFDIYHMKIPHLSEIYINNDGPPNFGELYQELLDLQQQKARTAQIYIPPPGKPLNTSIYQCLLFKNTLFDLPHHVVLDSISHHEKLKMPALTFPSGLSETTCGITARLSIKNKDRSCSIETSSGTFHLRRIWTKLEASGRIIELFEGHTTLSATYGHSYRQRFGRHGIAHGCRFSFWAIRASVDQKGREIGIKKSVISVLSRKRIMGPTEHPAATQDLEIPASALLNDDEEGSEKYIGTFWPDGRRYDPEEKLESMLQACLGRGMF